MARPLSMDVEIKKPFYLLFVKVCPLEPPQENSALTFVQIYQKPLRQRHHRSFPKSL